MASTGDPFYCFFHQCYVNNCIFLPHDYVVYNPPDFLMITGMSYWDYPSIMEDMGYDPSGIPTER